MIFVPRFLVQILLCPIYVWFKWYLSSTFWIKWHWKCYWTKYLWTNSTTPVPCGKDFPLPQPRAALGLSALTFCTLPEISSCELQFHCIASTMILMWILLPNAIIIVMTREDFSWNRTDQNLLSRPLPKKGVYFQNKFSRVGQCEETKLQLKGVLHPLIDLWLFLHFSQKIRTHWWQKLCILLFFFFLRNCINSHKIGQGCSTTLNKQLVV